MTLEWKAPEPWEERFTSALLDSEKRLVNALAAIPYGQRAARCDEVVAMAESVADRAISAAAQSLISQGMTQVESAAALRLSRARLARVLHATGVTFNGTRMRLSPETYHDLREF